MLKPVLWGCLLLLGGRPVVAAAQAAQPAPVQPVVIKFGQPAPADFEAKNFAADSSAAVVLYDGGVVRFRVEGTDFKMDTEHTTRIKVLKKAGYDYATVEVPLYHSGSREEKITTLKGFTYNLVGGKVEKTKLETSTTFTEERSPRVRVRKFTLPAVREGAVLEYTYTVSSDFFFNLSPWTFQRDIPTRWSECRVVIPERFQYKMLMQGYEPLALQKKEETIEQFVVTERVQKVDGVGFEGVTSHGASASEAVQMRATSYYWAMQHVPALREEPFMTTTADYVASIRFELEGARSGGVYQNVSGGWAKINQELLQHEEFGGLLDRGGFLKEQLQPLAAAHADPTERAAAVRALVQHNVKYDGTTSLFGSGTLRHTWEQHRGNSADVNLLYIAALRQAGLPVQPVILSTRAHGRASESFPLLEQYNYVVGLLPLTDSTHVLLDATEPLLPLGVLPPRCLNQVGHLVSNAPGHTEGTWISLRPTQRHIHFQNATLALDAQGNLTGEVTEEHGGYLGAMMRGKLAELGEKKYVTELASRHSSWEIPNYTFSEATNVANPLRLKYELRQPAATTSASQELYLKLLSAFGVERNPFSSPDRKFPVDLGAPIQEVVIVNLTLPPGYVAELPKSANVALPEQGGSFVFAASSPTPNRVQLVSRLTLLKPFYSVDQYEALREFYRLALAKQSEALVVKKM